MSTPTRKLGFHSLRLLDSEIPDTFKAASELLDLVKRIEALPPAHRVFDKAKENKVFYLKSVYQHPGFVGVVFRTAKYGHRPPLASRTADERESPKTMVEGDAESTHLGLKFGGDEAIALLEERRSGMSMGRICEYLNSFLSNFARQDEVDLPFLIQHGIIPKGGFLEELNKLKRASVGEVFVEKNLLGDAGISRRTNEVRSELLITLKAEKKKDIREVVEDAFERLSGQQSGVKRVRVYGTTEAGKYAVIDTELIKRIEWLETDLHPETGEVNTSQIFFRFGEILATI